MATYLQTQGSCTAVKILALTVLAAAKITTKHSSHFLGHRAFCIVRSCQFLGHPVFCVIPMFS